MKKWECIICGLIYDEAKGWPDDGIARLYSAIEKLAKAALKQRGIDNSNATVEQLPEPMRADYERRYLNTEALFLKAFNAYAEEVKSAAFPDESEQY